MVQKSKHTPSAQEAIRIHVGQTGGPSRAHDWGQSTDRCSAPGEEQKSDMRAHHNARKGDQEDQDSTIPSTSPHDRALCHSFPEKMEVGSSR